MYEVFVVPPNCEWYPELQLYAWIVQQVTDSTGEFQKTMFLDHPRAAKHLTYEVIDSLSEYWTPEQLSVRGVMVIRNDQRQLSATFDEKPPFDTTKPTILGGYGATTFEIKYGKYATRLTVQYDPRMKVFAVWVKANQ